jgi:hypothetical protein
MILYGTKITGDIVFPLDLSHEAQIGSIVYAIIHIITHRIGEII